MQVVAVSQNSLKYNKNKNSNTNQQQIIKMGCAASGLGNLPPDGLNLIASDKDLLVEEKILGILVQRNFKTPNRRCNYAKFSSRFSCLALSDRRILAYFNGKRQINLPFDDTRITKMNFSSKNNGTLLCVQHNASLFQPAWSGQMEFQFHTGNADHILSRIQNAVWKAQHIQLGLPSSLPPYVANSKSEFPVQLSPILGS